MADFVKTFPSCKEAPPKKKYIGSGEDAYDWRQENDEASNDESDFYMEDCT